MIFQYFCLGKKFLVYNMVSRNIKSKYGRSILGLGWTVLSPIMLAFMYYLVFKKIMHVQMEHYLPFILSGVLPWAFFSQCIMEGMDSIVGNEGLVNKIPLPLQILPFVNTCTNLVTLSASIPVVFLASLSSSVQPGFNVLFVFYFYAVLFLIAYSLSLILSVGYVLFRDLRHIMTLVIQLWIFATPVVYSYDMVPEKYRILSHFNPVADAICGIHRIFADGLMPTSQQILISGFWALTFSLFGIFFMHRFLRTIVEKL